MVVLQKTACAGWPSRANIITVPNGGMIEAFPNNPETTKVRAFKGMAFQKFDSKLILALIMLFE